MNLFSPASPSRATVRGPSVRRTILLLGAAALAIALGGCEEKKPPLKGERISVLAHENEILPDAALVDVPVELPRPVPNEDWPQAGGSPTHDMEHLEVPEQLRRVWGVSIGEGVTEDRAILPEPVMAEGRIFTMDTNSQVRAFDAQSGKRLWSADVLDEDEADSSIGGGVAYGDGRLYVTTGYAVAFALNPGDGSQIWKRELAGPMRAPPTFSEGRLYVVTIDNELYTLDAATGKTIWKHSGISEIAGLLGGSAPAVEGNTVIVPYSSGELYALQTSNGRVLWSDNLGPVRRGDIASTITDIRGLPVVDKDQVYAISHGGRMVAIDFKTGRRVWDKLFGGVHTPWVVGDYIYVLTNDQQLLCLSRKDGRVRWVATLLRYENPETKEDPVTWSGPVLASDRLIVTGSRGAAVAISPYTGEMLGKINLPGSITLAPIVAGETIYVLTDSGELVALR